MGTVSVTTTYKVKCKFCGTENLEWHFNPITDKYWLGDAEDHLHRCVRGVKVKVGTPVPKRPRIGKHDPISKEVAREDRHRKIMAQIERENNEVESKYVVHTKPNPYALRRSFNLDLPTKGQLIQFDELRKKP
jgi:hypothetical protein